MKTIVFACMLLLVAFFTTAQPKPKPKQPSQAQMNKMMEEAMKNEGMSKEEQAEMKKMMGEVMPAIMEKAATTASYPEFTSNKQLIPARDIAKTSFFSKMKLTQASMAGYATTLYSKLMFKGNASETALARKIIAQTPKHSDINSAAVLCMIQGHPEAAMLLSMKAVQLSAGNINYQNNMAALLAQYGYPGQALPVLKKLWAENRNNSTITNNLSLAWFGLGETDSAIVYANAAMRINANHPEASQIAGLVKEANGNNPYKDYTQSMENAPNPFTQALMHNGSKTNTSPQMEWAKIKKNLTIYEYFTMKWMEIPTLSNTVKGYEDDMAIKRAYEETVEKMEEKIKLMTENTENELAALADKGDDAFASEMAKATMKELSWMSKPATNVLAVLQTYQTKNQLAFADSIKTIENWKLDLQKEKGKKIKAIYDKIDDKYKTNCEQFKLQLDALENDYLNQVNKRIDRLMLRHLQDYRQWLNAWITWSWYVAGNVKNIMMIQNLQSTQHLVSMYAQAAQLLEALPEHCGEATRKVEKNIPEPDIPNFTCPAVVSIPSGAEWQELSAGAKDFNKNIYNMTKTGNAIPNVTVAYGIGSQVAQPGRAPFVKTANGSMMPGAINTDDNNDELAPLPDVVRNQMAKELMQKMLSGDCKKVKTDKQNFKEAIERMEAFDRIWRSIQKYLSKTNVSELQNEIQTAKGEAQQNGLQPSISSGVQAPGTFQSIKNLFN